MPFFLFTRDEPTIDEVEYVVEADTPERATAMLNDGEYKSRNVVDTAAADGEITAGPTPCDADGNIAEDDDAFVPPGRDAVAAAAAAAADDDEDKADTLEEKRREVARRRATCRLNDGQSCTSVFEEIYSLVWNGGKGVDEWTEEECDDYLSERDEDGEAIDDEVIDDDDDDENDAA